MCGADLPAQPFALLGIFTDCAGPAEIIERKVAPEGSVSYYVHYMDCKSHNLAMCIWQITDVRLMSCIPGMGGARS